MNYGKIATRYAKALFTTAVEENVVEQVKNDMLILQQLIAENTDFVFFLNTPILKPSEKKDFFISVFNNQLQPLTLRFLDLLTTHRRENRLSDIIRNYHALYLQYNNTVSANLITTLKANETMLTSFKEKLQTMLNKTVLLENKTDESIVGGFILQLDDKEYDASVKTQLQKVKKNLINTSMIK
ncbi:MAG: ATP synthase F1 subunit delta [Bacteroidales bacterium]|nr:ATP synthase F1 subunit delta [Bacteroidales bacterium]